tara:strand:+ start:490 stop:1089 length:600 start_codon:yes stop_codon:yes gene_type:complete
MEEIINIKEIIIIIIISYLSGSIPFGYILTKKFLKQDIRKIGSGNIGATNVLRAGNKKIGYLTLILDILKSVLPVIIIKIYQIEYVYIASLCVFLGHVFPIWLKFKGGKGVATYVGILFCLNVYLGICFCIIWVTTFLIFKYSSLSSLIAAFSIPIFKLLIFSDGIFFIYIIFFILVFFNHRENIKRLINGKETKTKIY